MAWDVAWPQELGFGVARSRMGPGSLAVGARCPHSTRHLTRLCLPSDMSRFIVLSKLRDKTTSRPQAVYTLPWLITRVCAMGWLPTCSGMPSTGAPVLALGQYRPFPPPTEVWCGRGALQGRRKPGTGYELALKA